MKSFEGFDFFLSQIKPNLKDVTAFSFDYLLDQYKETIDLAGGHLIRAARELKTENEKARFISSIEQCQRMKNGMVTAFGLSMMEAYRILNGEEAQSGQPMDIQGSLSSLASHAREDDMYIYSVVDKAGKEFYPWVEQTTSGLQKALPGVKINEKNNPFSPMAIGNALHASLKITSMHSSVQKEIYVLFRDHLFSKLGLFYQQILQELKQAGIKVVIPGKSTTLTMPVIEEDIPLLEPVTMELDTIDSHFNELIENGVVPPGFNSRDYTPLEQLHKNSKGKKNRIVPLKEIDSLLANIQKGYDPTTDGEVPEYIRSHLALDAKENENSIIAHHDENVINLISLVFDQIAETQSEAMAKLFFRLKVPYTRIVLNDELFFHDTSHPARLLLDNLLALTYSSHDDELLYKQLQNCVTKILLRYNGEQKIFTDLLATVDGFLKGNAGPFRQSQEAMTAKFEADEKRRLAITTARELIQKKTAALARKLRFHIMVEKIWENILTDLLLTRGAESKQWQLAVKILDIIIFLTSSGNTPQFRKLTEDLPMIAGKLSQFLSENNISQERKQVFIDQLQEIQILLLRGKSLKDLDDDDLAHTFDIDLIIDDYESEMVADIDTARIGSEHRKSSNAEKLELTPARKRPSHASAKAFVDNLAIGQWMNFIVDGQRTPCVVSYFSRQKESLTFCDRHNQKLFERKKSEIIEDLVSGFACPLENTICFEGILARVLTRISHG